MPRSRLEATGEAADRLAAQSATGDVQDEAADEVADTGESGGAGA